MPDISSSSDTPGGPAVERLHALLNRLRTTDGALSDDEIQDMFSMEQVSSDQRRAMLVRMRESVDGYELSAVRVPAATIDQSIRRPFAIAVLGREGHIRRLLVGVENRAPYRIRGIAMDEGWPDLAVRRARAADAAALREIELLSPIVSGDVRVVYDRGGDYFATERLMGNTCTIVVERDGVPVGLNSVVNVPLLVGGEPLLGEYSYRLRIVPDARGGRRVNRLLGFTTLEVYGWQADEVYAFVAAGNDTVLSHDLRIAPWSVRPERIVISTGDQSGAPVGRRAMSDDGARIVALLNRAHSSEELYVPYTAESLAVRLEREPSLYSWQSLRLGDRAVVGVWPAQINVIRETAAGTENDVRALVLDYGYEPGAEDELVALLRAACADLAPGGATEVALFTCPQSPAYPHLVPLAKRIEPYVLSLRVLAPADLAVRGIYVDQLYF